MNKSYKVVHLPFDEIITLESTPRPLPARRDVTRFRQFVDNVALAIITGDIEEATVREETTDAVYDEVLVAMQRFDSMSELYSSRSSLGGVNEYLNPEFFTFSGTFNNTTH